MKKIIGFTLIELLVVIAIVGIISSVAYPSYQSHLLKTRRGEAITELLKAQLKQSSLHILASSYSTDKTALGLIDSDNYTYSVISASNTTYVMQATANTGSLQESDTGCTTLSIDENSTQTPINCW